MPSGRFHASTLPAFASFRNSCESPDLHKIPPAMGCTVHRANSPPHSCRDWQWSNNTEQLQKSTLMKALMPAGRRIITSRMYTL